MDSTDLLDRLTAHTTLGGVPRRELEWLASHGTLQRLKEGDKLAVKDEPVAGLFVVLSGRFAIFRDAGAGRRKLMEWRGGDVAGLLPVLASGHGAGRLLRSGTHRNPRGAS